MLGCPKSSPGVKGPNAHSAHSPMPRYGSSEASQAAEATSASPEVSPLRSLAARHVSASPEGEESPSEHRQTPPRSRPPQQSPPRGLGAAGTLPRSRPPSADWSHGPTTRWDGNIYCQPLHGREQDSDGVSSTLHIEHDRGSIRLPLPLYRYSRHCVNLRRTVRTCLTLPRHCAANPLYFLLLKTLGRHKQQPSNAVRLLTGAWLPSAAPSAPRLIKLGAQYAL